MRIGHFPTDFQEPTKRLRGHSKRVVDRDVTEGEEGRGQEGKKAWTSSTAVSL